MNIAGLYSPLVWLDTEKFEKKKIDGKKKKIPLQPKRHKFKLKIVDSKINIDSQVKSLIIKNLLPLFL